MEKLAKQPGMVSNGRVSQLLEEAARRLIKGQECFSAVMDDFVKRMPDLQDCEISSLMAELTEQGFDITPNEWIFYTPVEYRAAMISTQFLRHGKAVGSREEDIKGLIKKLKDDLKTYQEWFKEYPNAATMHPQRYRDMTSKSTATEQQLKELEAVLKHVKSGSVLYSKADASNTPFRLIGIHIDEALNVVAHGANGLVVKMAVDELTDKPNSQDTLGEDNDADIPLRVSFEALVKAGDPLDTFYKTFLLQHGDAPEEKENLGKFISSFVAHIDTEKDMYEFSPEEINDAMNKLSEFSKANGIAADAEQYINPTIMAEEKSGPGDLPSNEEANDPTVPPADDGAAMRSAATKHEIKIADTVQCFDRVQNIISRIRNSVNLPRTAGADEALEDLTASLDSIRFFVREELVDETSTVKEAAYIVFRNLANELESVEKIYNNMGDDTVMGDVVLAALKKIVKSAKTMTASF